MLRTAPDVEHLFESDGAAALERIQAIVPDLVLMDIVKPFTRDALVAKLGKYLPAVA